VVDLKAEVASQEDKEYLAQALFYLRAPSTGTVEGDVHQLATMIDELVQGLGLKSTLSEHAVPRTDLPDIATRVLGSTDDPIFGRVVNLLEKIY